MFKYETDVSIMKLLIYILHGGKGVKENNF